ncbi:MAG: GIY-YIG nuclease family protein [Chloroflexota bacterium]
MPYTYLLQCADDSYYTGWTTDLAARLQAHNRGRGARYTRGRRPVRLVYWEAQPDRSAAQRREMTLRQLSRAEKSALVATFQPPHDPFVEFQQENRT